MKYVWKMDKAAFAEAVIFAILRLTETALTEGHDKDSQNPLESSF
jgi:hypothetical protein